MNRNLSIYIDLLRMLAALGVYFGHVRSWILPGMPILIGAQATQCVAIFFVLSGFVIAFVTDGKETHWRAYARARALRMYSVTILALVVGLACDNWGYSIAPGLYEHLESFKPTASLGDYLAYFSFTNQVWSNNRWIGSNQPFWSLGYEVPYYFVFGLAVFLRGPFRLVAVAAAGLLIGPRVMAYAPLWLLGVVTYRVIKNWNWSGSAMQRRTGAIMLIGSLIIYAAVRFIFLRKVDNIYHDHGLLAFMRTWTHFHLIGIAVAMNIIGFQAITTGLTIWPEWAGRSIRWAAGGSFTLYLVHFPLLMLSMALFPNVLHSPKLAVLDTLGVFIAAYILAELGERRKKALERMFPMERR